MTVTGWLSTEEDIGGHRMSYVIEYTIYMMVYEASWWWYNLEVLRGDSKDQFVCGHNNVILADEAHVRKEVGATCEEAGE